MQTNETLCEGLETVACRVLEQAAFVFADPVPGLGELDGDVVTTVVTFSGPASGWVKMSSTLDFGVEVAANLLGIEPDEPGASQYANDALCEILNMVIGEVVEDWFGEGACQLGIPEVVVSHDAAAPPIVVSLETDESFVNFTASVSWP
jgi:CheY-specific phosphatase CheX